MNDLKDVLARTAESAHNSNSTSELGDINKWLDEADAVAKAQRIADPETRLFRPRQLYAGPGERAVVPISERAPHAPLVG